MEVELADYDVIIVAAPLWWSSMAAPLQTFLFYHGRQMAGKSVGLIVSSASSGISGVVADAKRLIPEGNFLAPNLWIRSSQTANCQSLLADWLVAIDYAGLATSLSPVAYGADAELVCTPGGLRVLGAFKRLALFDVSGGKVMESADEYVDTTALTPGVYIVRIDRGRGRSVNRKVYINKGGTRG